MENIFKIGLGREACPKTAYEGFTLKSMTEFVFMLRDRTTTELCRDFPKNFTMPVYNGNQYDMVQKMLAIDAIQWKLTGEYGKFCRKTLNKNQFDQNDSVNCLFKGNWKISKTYNTVDDEDFHIDLDTLDCWQKMEGGTMDFKLIGNTIGRLADVIKEIELTELGVKQIFGNNIFAK